MPRPRKPARLWLRPARENNRALWLILDGTKQVSTGCGENEIEQANAKLAAYILDNSGPDRKLKQLQNIYLSDVITIYAEDVASKSPHYQRTLKLLNRLNDWWGDKTLADVTRKVCREYEAFKGNRGGTRYDLQILSAAIQHHHAEGLHRESIIVPLPPKGESRKDWLDRSEIARLLWAAWRAGEDKRTMRHLARFILMAYYTASRPGVIYTASWVVQPGASYIDLDRGVFYRRRDGAAKTNKRQPPVRIPPRLLSHLRRWKDRKLCVSHPVEWHGQPVKSVKVAFARALQLAGLPDTLSPYVFRHTAITHLLQKGVSTWEVSGFAGTSEKMIEDHYGHHSPDHMENAVQSFTKNWTKPSVNKAG